MHQKMMMVRQTLKRRMSSKLLLSAIVLAWGLGGSYGWTKPKFKPVQNFIAKAAQEGRYLAFGDPDHHYLDVYKLVSHPDVLKALSMQGYRAVAIEAPLYMQATMDLYAQGKVSRKAFLHGADMFFDNAFADDVTYLNMLADFIVQARLVGIEIHAVDEAAGFVSRQNAQRFHSILSQTMTSWTMALHKNPRIMKQSKEQQQKALSKVILPLAVKYSSLLLSEQKIAAAKKPDMTERYRYDALAATHVKAVAKATKGKVAIIFGNLHFERNKNDHMGGDIDHHLGEDNVTTINVYYDLETYKSGNGGELWRRMADPKSRPIFAEEEPLWSKLRGVADRPEYELDLKSATWLDWSKKKATFVALP